MNQAQKKANIKYIKEKTKVIRLPTKLHAQIKRMAGMNQLTMVNYVKQLIENELMIMGEV